MSTKTTKREVLNEIVEVATTLGNEKILNYALHEIELLDNKKNNRGLTTTQKENIGIKETIIQALTAINRPVTITELINETAELKKYSNPKITALMQQLKADNKVINIIDKKKSYYSIAE